MMRDEYEARFVAAISGKVSPWNAEEWCRLQETTDQPEQDARQWLDALDSLLSA